MRRGRRDPDEVRAGDAVDFWRVEAVGGGPPAAAARRDEGAGARVARVPGGAGRRDGGALLSQTALFAPRGLGGWLYWYALYPAHALIFSGMIRAVARAAEGPGERAVA
jgi:hypothetical protein